MWDFKHGTRTRGTLTVKHFTGLPKKFTTLEYQTRNTTNFHPGDGNEQWEV